MGSPKLTEAQVERMRAIIRKGSVPLHKNVGLPRAFTEWAWRRDGVILGTSAIKARYGEGPGTAERVERDGWKMAGATLTDAGRAYLAALDKETGR